MKFYRNVLKSVILAGSILFSVQVAAQSDAATNYFNEGKAYSDNSQYNQAVISLTEAIRLNATNQVSYNFRGHAYLNLNEYDKAIADFKEAIRLLPGYGNAHFNLGKAYYKIEAYDLAIEAFTEAIRLDPKDKNLLDWRGSAYKNNKDYEFALKDYNEYIRQDPKDVRGYNLRGNVYFEKGYYDDAILSYTEAINLNPAYATSYENRGNSYYNIKEYDIAISDYAEAIRIDPNNESAHFNLGKTYKTKGNYDMAIKEFTEAIRINPNDKYNYGWRADVYKQKKDYEAAINDYNQRIRLNPKDIDTYKLRADIHIEMKEYDAAINDYSQLIRLDPKDFEGYMLRARIHITMKQYDKAINDYSNFIRLDPTSSIAYSFRAGVYSDQKIYDLAIKDYTEAIRLSPEYVHYYLYRGQVYKEMGQVTLAIGDYNKAVLMSGKPSEFIARAKLYAELKKYDLAFADFAEAIRINPNETGAYGQRADLYLELNKFESAIADLSAVIRIYPDKTWPYYSRAIAYKENGIYDLAIKDFETAIRIDPDDEDLYINSISSFVRTQQFAKAKEYYIRYKELQLPGDLDLDKFYQYYIKAVTEDIPANEYGQALINLNAGAKEYDPENTSKGRYTNLLALKGYVLEKLNRFNEAKDVYEQALSVNSRQTDVKQALAVVNKKLAEIANGDKIPPEIELISPQNARGLQVVANNSNTQIIGKAKDPSGIASVTLNGKLLKIEEDGLFVSPLIFKSGANDISIIAVDKKGNSATKTFTINGSADANKQESDIIPVADANNAPQYHAILIASQDYTDPSIPDLENPVKDASELKTILESNYTFDARNIETLYNKSREEIMQALVSKSNSLTENDNLVIFYAGHGIAEKDKFGDVDGYWIPSSAKKGLNASYISADDINKALKRSNSKHILVVADACFSGAFTRALSSDASVGIQKQFAVPSRKIMASGNLEPVPDNSKFVFYLKKNLKENKEKYLTAKKLFDSFYEAILNNSDTSPQYAAIKNVGDEGGEFVFIKK
ncbi:tetratricopeptide repeat protein [Flavihumibacter sp. R14]|nr:tetratricopeptide repeat protein [Flavihumibacter soli]